MKTTDLRLNNWVWQRGSTTPSRVVSLAPDRIGHLWADGSKHTKDAWYFDPVTLTPARLRDNGWNVWQDHREDHRDEWTALYNDGTTYACIDSGSLVMTLQTEPRAPRLTLPCPIYFHQLQNLLTDAGLEDMANNFKLLAI